MTRLSTIETLGMIGLVVSAFVGCATGGASTPRAVDAADVPRLAGGWQGYAASASGQQHTALITINRDGTYYGQFGAFTTSGTVQARDGRLVITATATSGIPADKRVSEAVLTERADRWVITGYGHTDGGPFSYEVSRQK